MGGGIVRNMDDSLIKWKKQIHASLVNSLPIPHLPDRRMRPQSLPVALGPRSRAVAVPGPDATRRSSASHPPRGPLEGSL